MLHIQIFEPALCCSTGVCGVDVDQTLVTFTAEVARIKAQVWLGKNALASVTADLLVR